MQSKRWERYFLLTLMVVAPIASGLQYTPAPRPFPKFYRSISDVLIVLLCAVLCATCLRRDGPAWLGIASLSALIGTMHLLSMIYGGLIC